MEIQIDRNDDRLVTKKVTIYLKNTEFEIEVNNFGELVIRKVQYREGFSNIIIRPKASNEIGLS